jgi:mannosylglycoprotein endo-beta-mannosidase
MQVFIQPAGTTNDAAMLDQPFSTEEIPHTLRAGARHKSPGIDGVCLEFYTASWGTIWTDLTELNNQMFILKKIHPRQKHRILVRLPKLNGDHTPEGYRPISLLTTEYKILARILTNRLRHSWRENFNTCNIAEFPGFQSWMRWLRYVTY